MCWIFFWLSFGLCAQSAQFLVPPIETTHIYETIRQGYDTVKKGVQRVLQSVFSRKKPKIRLDEQEWLSVPAAKSLPDALKTEFLSLVLNDLCATEEEYYAELCKLEELLELLHNLSNRHF